MTEQTPKIIITVPVAKDSRWKAWCRTLSGVDQSATNGYAFQGQFLTLGRKAEVPVGAYIMRYDEVGSRSSREPVVSISRVEADGTLTPVLEATGRSWALDLRDEAAKLFASAGDEKTTLLAEREALLRRLAEIDARLAEL